MRETVYSSTSELRRPAAFLAGAFSDLKAALPAGWHLFRKNVRARYRRSWLGYAWLLLPALATTSVCVLVTGQKVVHVGPTTLPYPLHVLAGMILWQVFAETLGMPLQQLAGARPMVTRSRVPHEALFLAGLLDVFLNCAVRLLLLLAALPLFGVALHATLILVPIGIVALVLLGLALGMIVAPAGLLYDDVGRGLTLLLSLWFFLTPIAYPRSANAWLRLNPVTPLLDTTRGWVAGAAIGDGFVAVIAVAAAIAMFGWLNYRLARPHVIARLG